MSKLESKVKAPPGANARKKKILTKAKPKKLSYTPPPSSPPPPPYTNLKQHLLPRPIRGSLHPKRIATTLGSLAGFSSGARALWDNAVALLDNGKLPDPPSKPLGLGEAKYDDIDIQVENKDGSISGSVGVAVSDMTKRYTRMIGSQTNFRIAMCEPLVHIGANLSVTGVPNGIFVADGSLTGTTVVPSGTLSAMNGFGLNPVRMPCYNQQSLTTYAEGQIFPDCQSAMNIGLSFSRWRYVGPITFHYEPQAATSSPLRLEFAYTEDAYQQRVGLGNSGATATSSAISSTPYSVAFSPWLAWSMTVPSDGLWHYTYGTPQYGSGLTNTTFASAVVRDTCAGAVSGICIGTVSALTIFGRLMMECEIEFLDPVPMTPSTQTLTYYQALIADDYEEDIDVNTILSKRNEGKEVVDDDDGQPDPISPPTPISIPSNLSSSSPYSVIPLKPTPLTIHPTKR